MCMISKLCGVIQILHIDRVQLRHIAGLHATILVTCRKKGGNNVKMMLTVYR